MQVRYFYFVPELVMEFGSCVYEGLGEAQIECSFFETRAAPCMKAEANPDYIAWQPVSEPLKLVRLVKRPKERPQRQPWYATRERQP